MSDFDRALKIIGDHQKPKEELRELIREEYSTFHIFPESVDRKTNYLPLPLLQKVEMQEITKGDFRQILAEEELGRGKKFEYVPLEMSIKEMIEKEKKFLFLGSPGRGKTEFLKDLAWKMAGKEIDLGGRYLLPVFISLRGWEENQKLELEKYLATKNPYKNISYKQWKKWTKGEVALFLDGLDELQESSCAGTFWVNRLLPLLNSDLHLILSCRTFNFEAFKWLSDRMPVYYLDCLNKENRDLFIRNYPAKNGTYDPEKLIEAIEGNPSMTPLSTSPLLLGIICYLVKSEGINLPTSQFEFYGRALKKLLMDPKEGTAIVWPGKKPDWKDKLRILRKLVWRLWKREPKKLIYGKEAVENTLLGILKKHEKYKAEASKWQDAFLEDLHTRGIMRKESENLQYSFLHLSFVEYLVASSLAEPLKNEGWTKSPVCEILKKNQRDPLWANVMSFLSESQGEFVDRVIGIKEGDPILNKIPSTFKPLHDGLPQTYSCGGQKHTVFEYVHTPTGLKFVLIPGGYFLMGSDEWEDSRPIHLVRLEPFLMSRTVVTQGVWKKVMKSEPWKNENGTLKDYVNEGDDYPATYVSWEMAREFCEKIGLSLPTESQWEYSCRTGTGKKWYWGNSPDGDYMWYNDNAWGIGEKYAHEVGQKKPNAFGLFDMSGNVWEYCGDGWHYNYKDAPVDGRAWQGGLPVWGGGSWGYVDVCSPSAYRGRSTFVNRSDDGFRLLFAL